MIGGRELVRGGGWGGRGWLRQGGGEDFLDMGVATLPREERVMPMQYQERGSYEHAVSEMEGYDESARGGGLMQRSSGGGRAAGKK